MLRSLIFILGVATERNFSGSGSFPTQSEPGSPKMIPTLKMEEWAVQVEVDEAVPVDLRLAWQPLFASHSLCDDVITKALPRQLVSGVLGGVYLFHPASA